MKTIKCLMSVVVLVCFAFLFSCKSKGGGSTTTGWSYNDAENGGFEVTENVEQETGPGLVLIEGGKFSMGRVEQDVIHEWNNQPRSVTVSSFYMDETEVRNVDYREYLNWIARVFVDNRAVYRKALPDTLVWRRRLAYNEPYVEYYFRHPAYHQYPVVGVNWLQANDYCLWRTDRVNEKILIEQGYLDYSPTEQKNENNFNTDAYLAGQYTVGVKQKKQTLDGGERDIRMEDGILLPKYRLPTEAEWEYAALSLIGNSVDERIYTRKLYPWTGHFLRNRGDGGKNNPKDSRGRFMANFVRGRGDMMGVAGYLNDNASIPGEVTSYWPNDYGLYCMAGNVSEWVSDVYRPLSLQDGEEFNPYRGNIFTTKERDADGNIVQKDSLGRIIYRNVTDEESMNRDNYKKSDNINFIDGDVRSSILLAGGDSWVDPAEKAGSDRMYRQGKNGKGMTSMVTDHSRVYKGGSWRDRAYWLVPGTRRFLDEKKSTDDLGFRCAMTRVGSPGGNK